MIRSALDTNDSTPSSRRVDVNKAGLILTEIYETSSSISDLYINMLFPTDETTLSEQEFQQIIRDCFYSSLKCVGYKDIQLSTHCEQTFNSILNSINVNLNNLSLRTQF
jgi:outer membrane protein OmpA-like peptidoglycan-associated protein